MFYSIWRKRVGLPFWACGVVCRAAPGSVAWLAVVTAVQGVLPGITLWCLGGLAQWLAAGDAQFPLVPVAVWAGVLLFGLLVEPFSLMARVRLNERLTAAVHLKIMQRANALDTLACFADSATSKDVHYLKETAHHKPMNFVYILTSLIPEAIAVSVMSLVLVRVGIWLPLGFLLVSIPHAIASVRLEQKRWDIGLFRSPEARRLSWLSSLALDPRSARELRVFGFGKRLARIFQLTASFFHARTRRQRRAFAIKSTLLSMVSGVAQILLVASLVLLYRREQLDAVGLILGLQGLIMLQAQVTQLTKSLAMLTENLLFFGTLRRYLGFTAGQTRRRRQLAKTPFEVIAFHDVSFSYPDGKAVLADLNFTIRAGERIALVGENGSGKSTLIHLLCGLHRPTRGNILIDGVDLQEIDLAQWRTQLSVVFQEYSRYSFSVRENIAIGDPVCLREAHRLHAAMEKGGFLSVLDHLPCGYRTRIGLGQEGPQLSPGQWQRLAASRAFAKQAPLLIFDEPAAALDALAEKRLLAHLDQATFRRTAIFITHRFSTVRLADRIVVLKGGSVCEQGAHEALMERAGHYAALYTAQTGSMPARTVLSGVYNS